MSIYQDIHEYLNKSKTERQSHLNLSESCIELGTDSRQCRGLLAHYLKTMVPKGKMIHCCHACNNAKCSNPKHLYWGTIGENMKDANMHSLGGQATARKTRRNSKGQFYKNIEDNAVWDST
jgi:hypothetical protein